jgi:hypothetical protein
LTWLLLAAAAVALFLLFRSCTAEKPAAPIAATTAATTGVEANTAADANANDLVSCQAVTPNR